RAARLIRQTSAAVAEARERAGQLAGHASDATRRAHEQLAKTELITESLDEVTAQMNELGGQLATLAPAARTLSDRLGPPVARAAALAYGLSRALAMRRGRPPAPRRAITPEDPATAADRRPALARRQRG